MAFLECECGTRINLSSVGNRVTCVECGRSFTTFHAEEHHDEWSTSNASGDSAGAVELPASVQKVALSSSAQISSTMMQDLPVLTQFENHYAQSIVAVGTFASAVAIAEPILPLAAAALPLGVNAIGSGVKDAPTNKSQRRTKSSSNESRDVQLTPGQRLLDRYEVRRKIGQGGMSSVYEACDHVRGETVALKILLPHLASKTKLQERFLQEGRLSSNFSHPNIARVYDLQQTDSMILLSMELLQGSTLRHDMHRRKTQGQSYQPGEVVSILQQICDALAVVHAAGIVHRDLKPDNIWLGLDGTIKVMDFGIAREAVRGAHTTGPRGSGTPYYISPEQLAASPVLDHRADQYSLAVVAYELLTGELPQGVMGPPHSKVPTIPKRLSQTIFRGMSSDPRDRFASIDDFRSALVYERRMPLFAKAALTALVLALVGSGAFAFQRWGMPLLVEEASPIWNTFGDQEIVEGQSLSIDLRHPDCRLEGKSLKFKLMSDAPDGATIDDSTAKLTWTPSESQGPRDHKFNVMALVKEEGKSQVIEERTIHVDVKESLNRPLFDTPEMVFVKEHQAIELPIAATDPNEPRIGLHYELVNPQPGMTINDRTGVLKWIPREEHGGVQVPVQIRVALAGDENYEIATVRSLLLRVEESNDPVTYTSTDRLAADVGEPVNFRVTSRDPNIPALNTYYRLRGGDRIGMTIDPISGVLYWTPTEELSAKEFEVTVESCFDGAGKTEPVGSQVLKVSVNEYRPQVEKPKVPSPIESQSIPASIPSPIGGVPSGGTSGGTCPSPAGSGGRPSTGGSSGGSTGTCPSSSGGKAGGGSSGSGAGQAMNNPIGQIVGQIIQDSIQKHQQNGQGSSNPANQGNGSRKPNNSNNSVPGSSNPGGMGNSSNGSKIGNGSGSQSGASGSGSSTNGKPPSIPNGNTGINGGRIIPNSQNGIPPITFPSHNNNSGNSNHRQSEGHSSSAGRVADMFKQKLEQDIRTKLGRRN